MERSVAQEDEEEEEADKKNNGVTQETMNSPLNEFLQETVSESACSLYISRGSAIRYQSEVAAEVSSSVELSRSNLEEAIRASNPLSSWRVSETSCGLIVAFARETDAERLLQRGYLARVFEGPIQVARFSARDTRYRQAVLFRDVPWAIPLQDLSSALEKQGIACGNIERIRQYVRVEVLDTTQYETLLRQGLDFFGVARFTAIPERWWRTVGSNLPTNVPGVPAPLSSSRGLIPTGSNPSEDTLQSSGDGVLQCYRCQGFWHVAANCRHLPRCVRCGEPHSVEFCPRPRNSPVCCHCSGPHHAGYRQCPVRLQLSNATPISITLSTGRNQGGRYSVNPNGKSNGSSEGLPLKSNQS